MQQSENNLNKKALLMEQKEAEMAEDRKPR